ncbi:MAG: glycosyltransferase family 2 protein, partial [Bacteroidales bacterium]|nr:glycosyltransferase family 2 protein [Bacteroidales bacterium]
MGSFDEFFKEERICVIVPTYNNAATLAGVLDRVLLQTSNLIVVNDGSTDDTWRILEEEAYSCVEKVSYQRNRGKGYALKSGFKRAMELGYSYALTLDSDGQHFPEDIQAFADKFRTAKGALL